MDVVVYGDVDVVFGVVPFQVEYEVKGPGLVGCTFSVGLN